MPDGCLEKNGTRLITEIYFMILSKENTRQLSSNDAVKIPGEQLFELPEKVLQFGTGVLLRGLPDYFIDKANKQGIFNGRIVVIKSTSTGGVDAFSEQDGLYTLCVRGVEGDQIIEENILNASISRVLSASTEWNEILRCATNPEIEIVISNTTEAGVVLTDDDIRLSPPTSFPGKLLACLHHRYEHFKADKSKGMIIIPTELLVDNGTVLKSILIELANKNKLSADFMGWLVNNNHFCNSLVDRIVPGKMAPDRQQKIEEKLGYRDNLLIMSESYRLWAIETNDLAVNDKLSFHKADEGVVITGDIGTFREVKLRLLNGSHTFTCGLAHLCGFVTVKEAMENKAFRKFITDLMLQEIVPAILDENISHEMATDFAQKVIDRYRNPHIDHQWLSIAAQYSIKMKSRNVPTIKKHYERSRTVPENMALGFAAFLLFMKTQQTAGQKFSGQANNQSYIVSDDNVSKFSENWLKYSREEFVKEILSDESLWDADLSTLPGFQQAVTNNLQLLESDGAMNTLENS